VGEILNAFRVMNFENEGVHYYEILVPFGGLVKSMQCNVQFGYQLRIFCTTDEGLLVNMRTFI